MIKEKLLELFESNKGAYFSGEEIAGKLGVSRAAVWKAVKGLRSEGYPIDAVTNKGYRLSENTDILSPQGIKKYLKPEYCNLDLHVLPSVPSTNTLVREKAQEGLLEGYTVIANEQTGGRGRYGRSFFSPSGSGMYLSILLRPSGYCASQAARITTMAAVAMCEAIDEVSEKKPQIKWVNDLYLNGKKICGILTEASFGLESGLLEYAVLGIGLNIYRPEEGFPEEIQDKAGFLYEDPQDDLKNRLCAGFLNHFMYYYQSEDLTYVETYRSRNLALGRQITTISGNERRNALVCDIDDECHLVVKYEDGTTEHLSYGEIEIRF